MDEVNKVETGKTCEHCAHGSKKCGCMHHNTMPIIVILIALTFLLNAFGALPMQAVEIIWPILVIVGALVKMMSHKCKCC